MPRAVLYPSAVDYLRAVVNNTVDNLLAAKPGYLELPPLYQRAYVVAHETGAVVVETDFAVESDSADPSPSSIIVDPRTLR